MLPSRLVSSGLIALCLLAGRLAWAAENEPAANAPAIAPASGEGELAINRFKVPPGTQVQLFAAEPMLANPVAFCVDAKGRIYVAETFRQQRGVEDNRNHINWLLDDLAAQTVNDRLAMFRKHLGEKVSEYSQQDDRIRLLEDTDGDGRADRETVFADGFNTIVAGTGAGVLAHRGNVYYTCIPDLWLLRDENGDGNADVRESLHTGYGVRVAFRGHDMHGLVSGPDGRLYFSIGDRGYNVTTQEGKQLARPDTGAVFRCNPDGSELEVFAYGLRNPQELAFDKYGNLFTGDNNSDSGDEARWVYVVEGADVGWRMQFQYLEDRGPWNRERMWSPYRSDDETARVQPAYIVPPVANLADGPSGLTYYPGIGLSERYDDHFFLADFRGTPANSGVRSFAVRPNGAGFELVDAHEFIWSILATDVDFGYDGRLYITDWVDGWNGLGKGRIYSFRDAEHAASPAVLESTKLMRDGLTARSDSELAALLDHADMRVRLEAQYTLADRNAADILAAAALDGEHQLARLHGIWGLGQIARREPAPLSPILRLLADKDPEVRAQTAKVAGDARVAIAADGLIDLLRDESLRVRSFAAIALGKLGNVAAVEPLLGMLAENGNADAVLRHAGVMGLVGSADVEALLARAGHHSSAARLGVLLALRRLESPEIALFLNDTDPALVLEAARAINDVPIEAAQTALAELAERPGLSDPLLRRALNANFRLGGPQHAERIARIAATADVSDVLRLEAVAELQQWSEPPPLDRVTNTWRPLEPRSAEGIAGAVRSALPGIFSGSDPLREAGVRLAAHYGIREVGPMLFAMLADQSRPGRERVEALRALASFSDPRLGEAITGALVDTHPLVRVEGRRLLAQSNPEQALPALEEALLKGEVVERQGAVRALADIRQAPADALLKQWLARLPRGDVPTEMQLDLLEAARERGTPELIAAVERFESSRDPADPLARFRETIAGGDAVRGQAIFFGRSEVSCRRCHKVSGNGGEVGPDLTKIGAEKTREYLLESLVLPSRQIAKGFETAVLAMEDGKVYVGVVKGDDGAHLQLMTAEGELVTIPKEEIEDQATGKSAMPEDLVGKLSKSDVRDLVEYMSGLKGE